MQTAFKACDGKFFSTRAECLHHEARLKLATALTEMFRVSVSTGRVQAVIEHIVLEADQLQQMLGSYRKSLPKVKTVQLKEAA